MNVKIKFFASYREVTRIRELDVEARPGMTAGDLLEQLVGRYPGLAQVAAVSRCVVNQDYVASDHVLKEGDEVVFIPPVSGGDSLAVTREPIDVPAVMAGVEDETVGGVVLFTGTVRKFSRGKRVQYLEYDAYEEMAERKLAEIAQEMRARWPVERVAIRHRFGRLEIGEAALVVAVGAAHRAEAFDACRYAVEEIKHSLPVWKKEVWEDGEVWVGMEGA